MPESPERPEKHEVGGGGGGGEHMNNSEHSPMLFAYAHTSTQTRSTKNATTRTTSEAQNGDRFRVWCVLREECARGGHTHAPRARSIKTEIRA